MLKDLIQKNRSYRRFHQNFEISKDSLRSFIELARLSASASNLQPLKYLLSPETEKNELIFPNLSWAGFLKDWPGPEEGEKPSAYIVMLGDTKISQNFEYDCGIAAQSILLGVTEAGLGGCIIHSIKRNELRRKLQIPEHLEILLVLALGKPKENVEIETITASGEIMYWRDKESVHHVPKRTLDEIIVD